MLKNASKLFQRRLYTYLNSWSGFTLFLVLCYLILSAIIGRLSDSCSLRGLHGHCSDRHPADNIAFRNLDADLSYEPFDVVYTWVNGSDPRWKRKKDEWSGKGAKSEERTDEHPNNATMFFNSTTGANETAVDPDDTMSSNRYRDSEELRFSLRSLVKNAPWIRRIFIVTDNQIPYWLNLESSRLNVISHEEIFANKSHLPVFSSPAIEANLHRIPGLSKKFIYFNDDVFLGAKVLPEDFISLRGAQRLVMSWDVPKCAPGCSDSWIGDGFCDKACNVSACNFDFPDCINGTNSQSTYSNSRPSSSLAMCAKGCPDTWLADKICDQRCKNEECGWDLGDCGLDLVTLGFPGVAVDRSNARIVETTSSAGTEFGYGMGASYQYGAASMGSLFDYTTNPPDSENQDTDQDQQLGSEDGQETPEVATEGSESASVWTDQVEEGASAESNVTSPHAAHNHTHALQSVEHHEHANNASSVPHAPRGPHHHFQSPALTVEYGTTAVYFDLSFLPCMYSPNATCVPEQTTNFLYERSEHDDESGNLIHSATLLSRHHLLVVLLYHGQDNAPEVNWIVYDVKFTVSVLNAASSETATATFSLRVFPQGHQMLRHPAELVPAGMALLPQSHAHSCLAEGAHPGVGANASISSSSMEIFVKHAEVLLHPYRASDEGAILGVEVGVRQNATVLGVASTRLAVAYTVTPTHGAARRIVLQDCSPLLRFAVNVASKGPSVGTFGDFCSKPACAECPATLQGMLDTAERNSEHFAAYVAGKGPARSPRFLIPAPSVNVPPVSSGDNSTSAVVAAEHVVPIEYRRLHLKVPMPVPWVALTSSQWFHVHVQVLVLPETAPEPTDSPQLHAPLMNQWHTVSGGDHEVSGQELLCVSAAVRWGRVVNVTAEVALNATTNAAAETALNAATNATEAVVNTAANVTADVPVISTPVAADNAENAALPIADNSLFSADYVAAVSAASVNGTLHASSRRLSAADESALSSAIANVLVSARSMLTSLWSQVLIAADAVQSLFLFSNNDAEQERAAHRRHLEDTYAASLVHVNRIYNKEFGAEGRKVPAHVPHMMDRDYLQEMQTRWPEQWNATSSHRFRSAADMQYSFSYYYYLANRAKVHSPDLHKYIAAVLDTDRDGHLNDNEFRSLAAVAKGSNAPPPPEFIEHLRECIVNSSTYQRHYSEEALHSIPHGQVGKVSKTFTVQLHPSIAQALNCTEITDSLHKNVNWGAVQPSHVFESDKEHVAFEMIGDNYTISVNQLDSVRARQSKFVCINDNMVNPSPELERALRSFYEAFFPEPCVFELPPDTRNPTLYLDEYNALKRNRHLGHHAVEFLQATHASVLRWLRSSLQAMLLPLAHRTIDALSEHPASAEDTARHAEAYVNGLRSDIHRMPSFPSRSTHQDSTAASLNRAVLLFSVVGVVGFALLRVLSKRRES